MSPGEGSTPGDEPLSADEGLGSEPAEAGGDPELAPIELAITDVFDLHSFLPKEVSDVARAYLDAAYQRGLRDVRIIHGRGKGVQRRTVRRVLELDPRVVDYGDAPPEAGGWGATWARLE